MLLLKSMCTGTHMLYLSRVLVHTCETFYMYWHTHVIPVYLFTCFGTQMLYHFTCIGTHMLYPFMCIGTHMLYLLHVLVHTCYTFYVYWYTHVILFTCIGTHMLYLLHVLVHTCYAFYMYWYTHVILFT